MLHSSTAAISSTVQEAMHNYSALRSQTGPGEAAYLTFCVFAETMLGGRLIDAGWNGSDCMSGRAVSDVDPMWMRVLEVAGGCAQIVLNGVAVTAMLRPVGRASVEGLADSYLKEGIPGKIRPSDVAEIRLRNGTSYFGRNKLGPIRPEWEDRLQTALNKLPPELKNEYGGSCAEMHALHNALVDNADLTGAVIRTAYVRMPTSGKFYLHGTPHIPCTPCGKILEFFGIRYIGS